MIGAARAVAGDSALDGSRGIGVDPGHGKPVCPR